MRLFGVFVNNTLDEAGDLAMKAGTFDVQFHGDEPPGMIAELATAYRAIQELAARQFSSPESRENLLEAARKVFSEQSTIFGQPSFPFYIPEEKPPGTSKLPTPWYPLIIRAFRGSPDSLASYLHQCESAGGLPNAILLDAHAPGAYGGTGQTLDWASIPAQRDKLLGLPLILAGGLTPDNVAEAIRLAHPDAVDVASGVESSPGKKDPAKVRDFIAAAKSAFAALDK
jgi:phosphoribosylanthranilate isomerase